MANVLITGANRGIGLALTKQFVDNQDTVFAVCRQSSAALDALGVNVIDGIDVSYDEALEQLKQRCNGQSFDIVICNAGILRDESLGALNLSSIREQFEVNALAPLNMIDKLQNHFAASGKIALITSRMGSIADNGSGGRYGYRMSKAALNAAAMSLSKDLSAQDISVGIYHPGYVQTDMVGGRGDISATECASRLFGLIDKQSMDDSGVFRHSNGDILPW
ncbi:SDR family oxidoreductase [Thalassotalea agarivorans]|uniref:Short-chain dehydrogenase n=1 Tax=Thalassotalea agarivorans TaxID=349064 RepID=A0A1I0FEI1_THASX|nr:SDR family oxidoreductase [Thalassotalea agarivorans]SET55610.1 Short-chain dehydrogenase [Thalassotalea agarivorans]